MSPSSYISGSGSGYVYVINYDAFELLYYAVLSPYVRVCVRVPGKVRNNRGSIQRLVRKLSGHGRMHIPFKMPWPRTPSVRDLKIGLPHIYTSLHVVRIEYPDPDSDSDPDTLRKET